MIKTTFTFCLPGLNRRLQMVSGMRAPRAHSPAPNFYKSCSQRAREWVLSLSNVLGCPPQLEGRNWVTGTPSHPHSQTAPSSHVPMARGRFQKRSRCTASAHTLPTDTKSSGRACQVPPSNLVDILIEEERSQRPPNGNAPCRGTFVFISFCRQ